MSAEATQWQDGPLEEGNSDKTGAGERQRMMAQARQRAAALGDLTVLAMQHPSFRNYAIADLDWLIGPAIITGNFLVANAEREDNPPVPIAAITWARVSEEVDLRLMENLARPFRLSPEEYVSGDIHWIAHTFGPPQAVEALIRAAMQEAGETDGGKEIPAGPLAGKKLKQRARDESGRVMVVTVG